MQTTVPYKTPAYVIWELTLACNLRCKHCAAGAGRKHPDELSTDEALDVCSQLAECGRPAVCLMGGEVFLRKDWRALTVKLRELGMAVGLITNGFLFNESLADEVVSLGVAQVGVSLDAARAAVHDEIRAVPGAHGKALRALMLINELPFRQKTVITSVNRFNIGELDGILAWLAEHTRAFTWMINTSSCHDEERFGRENALAMEDFVRLAEFINRNRPLHRARVNLTGAHDLGYFSKRYTQLRDFAWEGCRAGIDTFGLTCSGNVKGCLILSDKYVEGNVRERRLRDLWLDPSAFALNRRFHPDLLEGACQGCPHGSHCRGGCSDVADTVAGSPYDFPFCLGRQERSRTGR